MLRHLTFELIPLGLVLISGAGLAGAQSPAVLPSNQAIDPQLPRMLFSERPVDLVRNEQGDRFAVLFPNSVRLFDASGKPLHDLATSKASVTGLAFSPNGSSLAYSKIDAAIGDSVGVWQPQNASPTPLLIAVGSGAVPAGLCFDPTGKFIYAALSRQNTVVKLSVEDRSVVATVRVGVAPFGVARTPDGSKLFITNWGGRQPQAGEASALSSGTRTLVDSRGIAASGTVSVIDAKTFQTIAEIPVGLHPSGIQVSPDGRMVAVANANSDSVTLIDTASLKIRETIAIPAFPEGYSGSSPTAVAFNSSGQRLYVSAGGINAVAMLERHSEEEFRLKGFLPTDWYPVALAVVNLPGGETILAANSKGTGAQEAKLGFNVSHSNGSVSVIRHHDEGEASDSVRGSNDPFRGCKGSQCAGPELGDLGVSHVFLIIKENRTYDQVLGDLPNGNGDRRYTMYGADVTPNQHALAQKFVTLDNFYASGFYSAEGHHWLTQATASDYLERSHATYPRSYSYRGEDPLAFASSGFIWDNTRKHGLTARVFGEFAVPSMAYSATWADYLHDASSERLQYQATSAPSIGTMANVVESSFPSFALNIPDSFRARIFLDRFKGFVDKGDLPNLVIIQLPADHTMGANPGFPTPNAMVADNDLATGKIVEAITASPYWSKSAIFITEDDAQDGVDHVDGHRTTCFVISPFVKRGVTDSVSYNHTSVIRTIEELLHLPAMNKFDASALPMRTLFTRHADYTPFQSVASRVPLFQMNPQAAEITGPARKAAKKSAKMNFSVADAAPEEELNEILWHMAKGWTKRMPRVPHGPSCPKD